MRRCDESPPEQLLQAIAQFNSHEWFECHETMEELWIGEKGEIRNFYQGLLQIAVSLHHWGNGNFGGAISLLKKGTALLSCVSGICQQVDVSSFIAGSHDTLVALEGLGRERMWELKKENFPRLLLVSKIRA
jgi:predicted metal-dependent hydrolase